MAEEKDERPTVSMKDFDRAWYIKQENGVMLKLRFRKDGESGVMQFGPFESKPEAKQFLVQLKHAMV